MKLQFIGSRTRERDVREFVFKPLEPLHWEAGQYLHYTLPHEPADDRGIKRWFTISAAPSEGEVRITTRINHKRVSSFKQALLKLQPGDQIEAEPPEGDFTLGDTTRNYLFIIGGIGITPVRSILTEAASKGIQLHATLLYANRTNDIVFHDQLTDLQTKNPNLKINYVIEPQRIDNDLLKTTIDAIDNPLIYVSGPEQMVVAMIEQLKSLGVDSNTIHHDDFPGYEGI